MTHAVDRLVRLAQDEGLWEQVPLIYRSVIVAAVRRDPVRARQLLDALADLWQRAKEDVGG